MTTWTNISGGSAISESLADQAATSATNAATSATDASNSATSASTSATAAEAAKTAAQASETASAASETAAAASETAAASSETAAAASEAAAAASEAAAAGSATSASSSATSASTSASGAATSATNAANSESNAATSESSASTSASSAATSATAAAGSATSASNSASSAAADLATFRGQYHGASATAPTTGLDTGDLYFDTVANAMKVYDGSSWVAAYISSSGMLAAANNLSDVSSASASRTNLGLGTMATQAATGVDIDGGTIDGATIGGTSAGAVTATTLTATDASVISVSSSSDALRITQTGAGNALLVEDNTNPDSTPFVVDASGSVGIGAASPSSLLNIYINSVSDREALVLNSNGGVLNGASIDLRRSNVSMGKIDADYFEGMRFYVTDGAGAAATERMRIDAGGNVGIGTTSPDELLDIEGGNIKVGIAAGAGAVAGRLLIDSTTDNVMRLSVNRGGSTGQLAFHTGADTEAMRIDNSGKVGIGRTPTTNKLEVAGTIESTSGGFKFPDGSTQTKSAGHGLSAMIALGMA